MTSTAIAIVGAGPYGLSVAAHLAAHGLDPQIFGAPMDSWRNGMPKGMRLKSEGFASSLSDPQGSFTLRAFCQQRGLPYADIGWPVPLETFVAYGDAFQRRFVPQLDPRGVRSVARAPHGFTLELDDGTTIEARRVIVATGIGHFRHLPEVLAALPPGRVSHTSEHADYSGFAGRRVLVIGAGASAMDTAAALYRAGAAVSALSRRPGVRFYPGGQPRRLAQKILSPMTPLGPGWKKLACVKAPLLFHALPERLRVSIVKRYLGPAPGWFVRDEIEGKIPFLLSSDVRRARETAGGLQLDLAGPDGRHSVQEFDHVIAGTGYRIDVKRLRFIQPELIERMATTENAPKLSMDFESTVPGLHFVGTIAAYEFGPMLRFVCGAAFTARRVSKAIAVAEAKADLYAVPRVSSRLALRH